MTYLEQLRELGDRTSFCSRPYVEVLSMIDGDYRPCCYAQPPRTQNRTMVDQWEPIAWFTSSPEMRSLRSAHRDPHADQTYSHDVCRVCWDREAQGTESPRQVYNRRLFDQGLIEGVPLTDTELEDLARDIIEWQGGDFAPPQIGLALRMRLFGNYCNLRCPSCSPGSSSQIQTEFHRLSQASDDPQSLKRYGIISIRPERMDIIAQRREELLDQMQHIRSILMIGGEPLLAPHHFEWLEEIRSRGHSQHIELRYQTNLTELDRRAQKIFDMVPDFQRVVFIGSVDSTGDRNDYLRWGSSWPRMVANMQLLDTQARKHPGRLAWSLTTTTTWLSAPNVAQTWDWLYKRFDRKTNLHGSIVFRPSFLAPRHLPDELKAQTLADLERLVPPELSSQLVSELKQPRDPKEFQRGVEYLRILDQSRGQDFLDYFPEFRPYI